MVGVPKSKGCGTCRRRKKGCDLQRPICGQCQKAKIVCDGYVKPLIFKRHDWGIHRGAVADDSADAEPQWQRSPAVSSQYGEQDASLASRRTPETYNNAFNVSNMAGNTTSVKLLSLHKPLASCGLSLSSYHTMNSHIRSQSLALFHYFMNISRDPCSFLSPPHFMYESNSAEVPGGEDFLDYTLELDAREMIRDCASDELRLSAVLAALACRFEHMEGRSVTASSVYFVQSALALLRNELSGKSKINDNHLFTIHYLCAADAYRGNFSGALTHLRAAKKLIDDKEKYCEGIHSRMKDMFIRENLFLVQGKDEPLVFPMPSATESAAISIDNSFWIRAPQSALKHMGEELFLLPERIFTRDMREITKDIIGTVIIMENASVRTTVPSNLVRWLLIRLESLRHRLASVKASDPRGTALRVTMLVWIVLLQGSKSSAGSHRIMKPLLTRTLNAVGGYSTWEPYPRLYMWILTVSAMSTLGSGDHRFVEQLADTIRRLGCETIDEDGLRTFSESFLFFNQMQRDSLERLSRSLRLVFYEARRKATT